MKGVTKRTDMSSEALAVDGLTAFDISDDSRASSLPIGYSSLPSVAERLCRAAAGLDAAGGLQQCKTLRIFAIDLYECRS